MFYRDSISALYFDVTSTVCYHFSQLNSRELMTQSKPDTQFLMLFSIVTGLLFLPSCKSLRKHSGVEQTSADVTISSTPPFQTKEPERYQAVRSITLSKATGESVVTRTLIAKDGEWRRDEYETEATEKIVYLDAAGGRFILLPGARVYASAGNEESGLDSPDKQVALVEDSTDGLLSADPISTQYQKLGTEIINGRNATKYRVRVNTSGNATVSNGETSIWIDDSLSMPIRSETVTASGDRTTMELTGITLDSDKALFQVPDGYKKVTQREIREKLHARK
jgi:hypothetical protein